MTAAFFILVFNWSLMVVSHNEGEKHAISYNPISYQKQCDCQLNSTIAGAINSSTAMLHAIIPSCWEHCEPV